MYKITEENPLLRVMQQPRSNRMQQEPKLFDRGGLGVENSRDHWLTFLSHEGASSGCAGTRLETLTSDKAIAFGTLHTIRQPTLGEMCIVGNLKHPSANPLSGSCILPPLDDVTGEVLCLPVNFLKVTRNISLTTLTQPIAPA
jgi:hypothetical protein